MIPLCCPLDGEPLIHSTDQRSLHCSAGHTFDYAKEGYLNLLPAQHKRSKDPGDSKAMVQARRTFLEQGFYQGIAQAVANIINAQGAHTLLDAGCGEGYYIRQLAAHTQVVEFLGVDISKWAVRAAAKQQRLMPKPSQWVVASNAALPVASGRIDALLCMFGFPMYSEFARVLSPQGYVLLVEPGPDHLIELREILYSQVRRDDAPVTAPEGWVLREQDKFRQSIFLPDAEAIAQLLAMTPHIHRAPQAGRDAIAQRTDLALTIDVKLSVLRPAEP
ncbi:methyltransferase domain-containing protein [Aliidiomarina halalkaliphila]|uniref:Methyltransferase domain-containing protein n=1 Tax=Aliidiomarina halalkaliphila TaxID=2593535 RepID=A0A552X156_9GAMM|nr:methyltransferase domain-containing protein [Aliidiomarina halalkaliphila]TRW48781.1 methyltransferase domain-containing protein [Aliidiomarina halalkaliphila]